MKIAFFDSGLGGLSVLYEARLAFPREEFLFYADEAHVPYGTKSAEEVRRFVAEAFDFMMGRGVKAVVVACNTATSVAAAEMRSRYAIPIIGMEPAAKRALDLDGRRRVLVVATPITVRGEKMHTLIEQVDRAHLVDLLALPRLVEFAERQEFSGVRVREYLRQALAPYNFADYSALVLGCTHFNYFKDTFRELLPANVSLIDGNAGTVRELKRRLTVRGALENNEPTTEYYYSGKRVTDGAELRRLALYEARLARMHEIL